MTNGSWNALSTREQDSIIVDMYEKVVSLGLCSSKGRKPIADIQAVLEKRYSITLNTFQFGEHCKALLNKGDARTAQSAERKNAMLAFLASR